MPPTTELTSQREKTILDECQDEIGYQFQRPELLRAALTHTSGANTRAASNERLEFLGDSVLGLITCEQLFRRFPDYQEGDMTKVKSVVVSRKTCAKFSHALGLGDFLFLGKGLENRGEIPANIMADVFESLVGAMYIDGGLEVVKPFVLEFIDAEIDEVTNNTVDHNAKATLQQVAQREFGGTPRYFLLDEQGPDHAKCFKVAVDVNKHLFPAAWGSTKKDAELRAALNALARIRRIKPCRCRRMP
jgi:ribonuclease III